jgi:hypothetical protein
VTLRLWEHQQDIIDKVDMHKVCALEKDVMYVIQDMEQQGVRIDVSRAEKAMTDLTIIIDRDQKELNRVAGFKINPNPSQTIHDLFKPVYASQKKCWITNDGTRLSSTPKGKAKIDSQALREMKHPAAGMILKLRKMMKCRDTFIRNHVLANLKEDRVYPTINQIHSDEGGTVTGRLSMMRPALQQIPSRDKEILKIMRPLFIPDEGHDWYCADYSQADCRAFVHYTQTPPLIEAYAKDKYSDFHSLTAEITGIPRNPAYAGAPNCFDSETEYLTPTGWKKISEYDGGLVGQYDADTREVTYVKPIEYITGKSTEMIDVRNGDMLLTPNHRVLHYYLGFNNMYCSRTSTIAELFNMSQNYKVRIPTYWLENKSG